MKTQEYEKLDIEALESLNQDYMAQRSEIAVEQFKLTEVLDRKRQQKALADDLEKLQAKHGVKAQVISSDGIESEESVNEANGT